MIFARKINKIPDFYTIFAPKMLEFYITITRKIVFPVFWGRGGGTCPLPLPSPTPMLEKFRVCHCQWLGAHHPAQLSSLFRRDRRPRHAVRAAQLPQPLVSDRLQGLSDERIPFQHLVQVFHWQREQTAVGVGPNARHALRLRQQADFYTQRRKNARQLHARTDEQEKS